MYRVIASIIVILFLAAACAAQPSAESVSTAIALTAEAQPTATPLPEATATPVPTPSPTPLTPAGIFESLSPAVVRIESDGGFGSGVLIEGNYVLTNAHVVWPAPDAIVSFPGGATLEAVPVVGVDLLADLALLGPVETEIAPLPLTDGEQLAIGDTLLLIGYPGDVTNAPQPTLTETLISRLREQETFGITYFQVSAPVAGGQSGGIAVTMDGDVVGLTGNRITEAQYGLIASAADLAPRVAALLTGESAATGERGPEWPAAEDRHFVRLHNPQDRRVYAADLEKGAKLEISVDGNGDAQLYLAAPVAAESRVIDETRRGIEHVALTVQSAGTYYLLLQHLAENEAYTLTSNVAWAPYNDPDDGQQLSIGESYEGVLDTPLDIDAMNLPLSQGDIVNVRVSSILTDPMVVIESWPLGLDASVSDDNSGGGLFDTDAELTYRAPRSGLYKVSVVEPTGMLSGGYLLQVRESYEGAPTPTAPEPLPTPIVSPFGEMARWESDVFPFAFAYPAQYENRVGTTLCPADTYRACLVDSLEQNFIGVIEIEMGQAGAPETLDAWAQSMEEGLTASLDAEFLGREDIVSANNRPALVLSFANEDTGLYFKVFAYILDGDAAFALLYIYGDPAQEELINYVFSTFEVTR